MGTRPMRRALALVCGITLGLLLTEMGLRLYFFENEADRSYWGRGAFVAAEGLPYRHAPEATARVGREGSFGPHRIHTNARGLRDRRELSSRAAHQVAVLGASYGFGVGVEPDEALFHAKLEKHLRSRADWPDDTIVFNLSQVGYDLSSLLRLYGQLGPLANPRLVVLLLPTNAFQPTGTVDVRDGVRLSVDRPAKTPLVDWLRTHSFVWMRASLPTAGGFEPHRSRLAAWMRQPGLATDRADLAARQRVVDGMMADLARFAGGLASDGVALAIVPIGGQGTRVWARALEGAGYRVILRRERPAHYLPNDPHWSAFGHAAAARAVAARLPAWRELGAPPN